MQVFAFWPITINLWIPCFLSWRSRSVFAKPLEHQCSCATTSPGNGVNSSRKVPPRFQLRRYVVRGRISEWVRCTSTPRFLGPLVSVMRCEEDPDACGTGGQKDGKHVRYAVDRFCYILYQRP